MHTFLNSFPPWIFTLQADNSIGVGCYYTDYYVRKSIRTICINYFSVGWVRHLLMVIAFSWLTCTPCSSSSIIFLHISRTLVHYIHISDSNFIFLLSIFSKSSRTVPISTTHDIRWELNICISEGHDLTCLNYWILYSILLLFRGVVQERINFM